MIKKKSGKQSRRTSDMNFVPTHTYTCLQMPFFHIRTYPMVNKFTHPHVQHTHMHMQAQKDLSCHSFLLKLNVPNFLSNCLYYYYDYFVYDMCGGVFMLWYVCTEDREQTFRSHPLHPLLHGFQDLNSGRHACKASLFTCGFIPLAT